MTPKEKENIIVKRLSNMDKFEHSIFSHWLIKNGLEMSISDGVEIFDMFEQYMKELGYSEKLLDPNGDIIIE